MQLPAILTLAQAEPTLAALRQQLPAQGAQVSLDASALREFDSAALAVLLALRRDCQALGKNLVCRQPTPRLMALASLYGIEALITPLN